jgi:hypothetical protein
MRRALRAVGCAAVLWAVRAGGGTRELAPKEAGQRGEACQARNDCKSGLACIQGVCSKNDFDISAEAKQCDVVECETTMDCCGDKPTEAPAKCANINSICEQPQLPGCQQNTCDDDTTCNGGSCSFGNCSNSFDTCSDDTDCTDFCDVSGICFYGSTFCSIDADCALGLCQNRRCDCDNPLFEPFDPVCNDPDCQDVCVLRCEEERCVEDDSCESTADCPFNAPICDAGRCIECETDTDCDDDEACQNGFCDTPCTQNEECPLFSECMDGDCVETGCSSDRQCVLAFTDMTSEDSRLAKCLPSDEESDTSVCKIPCENDGSCAEFQVCSKGYCKFIGCTDNEQCRGYLGLANENPNGDALFVPKAVCR